MLRKRTLFLAMLILLIAPIPLGHADRAILPITDVDVYGPGQKAIIAWNGETERLILSTDLYASADTKILEVLPLPSKPTVEKGALESFQAIQRLMTENLRNGGFSTTELRGLEIVFHERIGAHEITVVKATSIDKLVEFMLGYTQKIRASRTLSIDEKTRSILEDYLVRGFNYWVFDLVDLYSAPRSIEPIAYEFQSTSLYYPLKVSATAKGYTDIVLYLVTSEPIREEDIPTKMRLARYVSRNEVVQFQLSSQDLTAIDPKLTQLFSSAGKPTAWYTAAKYEGDLSDLDFDFEVPPRPIPCRSIRVNTDKSQCEPGETVRITVDFSHLLPGCTEIEVIHFHQIRLGVFSSSGIQVQSWLWNVNGDMHRTVTWIPQAADQYVVKASSWWNGQRLEVEDQTVITASNIIFPPDVFPPDSEIWLFIYGGIVAVACVLAGAGLTYLLLRGRQGKAVRPPPPI